MKQKAFFILLVKQTTQIFFEGENPTLTAISSVKTKRN